ncbi:MAG: hypothetical protein DWH94_01320 [Planctomycetota bacterium]|nr:MAG: hypothetical protein DWH80_13025 [Planctomycetota bacterium]RLS61220.1 MAG: hypothetical protein DWH94_01320 [Planctomycetota bacterium]TSA04843.1 MAG: hypothetical protein D4R77_09135 [Planctomycetaceae bacterium]
MKVRSPQSLKAERRLNRPKLRKPMYERDLRTVKRSSIERQKQRPFLRVLETQSYQGFNSTHGAQKDQGTFFKVQNSSNRF